MCGLVRNKPPYVKWGIASWAKPGQNISGDLFVVEEHSNGVLTAVVDGLGHGEPAKNAAGKAVAILKDHPCEPVSTLVKRCHGALASTRGAVMTLASFDASDRTITVLGIGNVETVLIRASPGALKPAETVLLHGGVIGFQIPLLRISVYPVEPDDLLIFSTDGIDPHFIDKIPFGARPQRIAETILNKYFKGNDDALVLAVRFLAAADE